MIRCGRSVIAALFGVAALAGCGGEPGVDTGSSRATSTTSAAAPSTTSATAAATTTEVPAPSTTEKRRPRRTTTTLPELPTPIAPPPPGTVEPEIVLGTIEIPAIGVSKTLYAGITMPTLDKGPGYWPGSALPGQIGNMVVAGHRTSKDRPFRDIDQLMPGDEVIVANDDGRFVYAVTGTEVVTPDALWITDQTYEHRITLFACHPPGSTAYRIVVYADLVDPPVDGA